ncbi:MAG: N-acetyl-gamma-glutamyl-phosphate reductase [Desulfohalobiaceae bacterium]|nr:N-acetyl-gamma-glutamyl-phosphate reductase [Desulfohalobiaceae bacterium]
MQNTIQIAIVGVTGYTGMELIRLLANHPVFELRVVTSRQAAGKRLQEIYPHLSGFKLGEMPIVQPDPDKIAEQCSLAFLAVPHGMAMAMAAVLYGKGVKVVDLSADFRIRSRETYQKWYALEHSYPDLLDEAVYGLVEIYQEKIKEAGLVANPGCYPSSIILGLYPALAFDLIDAESIIIDSKSGATGAGRGAKIDTLFSEVQDGFRAYALGGAHRHTPEVEQELSRFAGRQITVSFNPHLLPVNRGILSTMYAKLKPGVDLQQVRQAYTKIYLQHEWVRILDQGVLPQLKNVRGTMLCDLGLVIDERTDRLIMVSAIDNLCRGASGQALANANLMSGLDTSAGLNLAPLVP